MSLTSDELVEKSKELRRRKRFEEALAASMAAIEEDSENADAWWLTALNRRSLKDNDRALVSLRKVTELAPRFSSGWARLGTVLSDMGNVDEAKEAFQKALRYESENLEALEAISEILQNEDDADQDEEEISILERIDGCTSLSSDQLNRLGILHFRARNHFEAIRYWQRGATSASGPASRYNLGLVFNRPEISQDADAIDMWRMTLQKWPDHERSAKLLADIEPRLLRLAQSARSYPATMLEQDQWYSSYLNPFTLINPSDVLDFDDFDTKTVQRLKKALLQEIELEDGKLSWIPGVAIDRSRAIGICDELNDETKRYYHWLVFSNKSLLAFLETGHHEHFLVSEKSPLETIQALEDNDDFREWISPAFVKQYDLVLSKAIERGNLVLMECLLDGRRWIAPQYTDRCFEGARRQVDRLMDPLRDANNRSKDRCMSVRIIKQILETNSLREILNLLPAYFQDYQNNAISQIRDIAISAYNNHGEIDLSKGILELARQFGIKSAALQHQLEEDFEKIEELIRKERENEAKKTFGGEEWEITKEGVLRSSKSGNYFIPAAKVSSVRWGIVVGSGQHSKSYDFQFVVKSDDGQCIVFGWKTERNLDDNEKHFGDLVNAAHVYLFEAIIQKIESRIASGGSVQIGTCTITSSGIGFQVKGWIFSDDYFIPWNRLRFSTENGDLVIQDSQTSKARTALSLRETDNAPVLRFMAHFKSKR